MFRRVDTILETSSVVKKSAAAALQKDMAVSDKFKWCLKTMVSVMAKNASDNKNVWLKGMNEMHGSVFNK